MKDNQHYILIVEDDTAISRFLTLELEHEGYCVTSCVSGRDGLELSLSKTFDLIVLDVMLPDLNGIEVLRRLRAQKDTPVIMLTARDTVVDKVSGLDIGASDYMTKPFEIEELLARIRANIKKNKGITISEYKFGDVTLNAVSRRVSVKEETVELTKKEFDLLLYLMENKGVVCSREKLLDQVWGFEFFGNTNVVDVYVRYIRSKIDDTYKVKTIETVRGSGYVVR